MAVMIKGVALVFLLLATQISFLLALPSTVPAFFWSSHRDHQINDAVNYRTMSSRNLADSILSDGGWSNLLCSERKQQDPVDVALIFVGRELLSSDIAASKNVDLVNLLKVSFTTSNFSMAFPYVAVSEEETLENMLFSGFEDTCGKDIGINNVAISESCFVKGNNFEKLEDLHAVQDHLVSKMEKRSNGQADLVVFCQEGTHSAKGLEQTQTEGKTLSELISSMEKLGAKYEVLYVSDPSRSIQYPSHQALERFLAEGGPGNGSADSVVCDEICKMKSTLLEGVFVGLVLLIILISGLCCMMGIDTPTRFEAPQDS
ncbi:hypothetical protein M5689_010371 [Euphorbia peplus]|nr:hypothetical protein M5689_010371 [Euphorbia peplus]